MTTTTRQPWFRVAPAPLEWDADKQTARWLAYAHAHLLTDTADHLLAAADAFICAAVTKGWDPRRAWEAVCDGDTWREFTWQWLTEYGINPDGIAPADDTAEGAAHLNAVANALDVHPEDAPAEAKRLRQAARAASMYLPEPERTNFRRQYGLGELTLP